MTIVVDNPYDETLSDWTEFVNNGKMDRLQFDNLEFTRIENETLDITINSKNCNALVVMVPWAQHQKLFRRILAEMCARCAELGAQDWNNITL